MVRKQRPNIVLIITDQERSHKHWPRGWAEENLPTHYDSLIGCNEKINKNRSSVHFTHAFTATTECSPSRASLLTSSYPTEHGVKTTPGHLDPRTDLGLGVDIDNTKVSSKTIDRPNIMRLMSLDDNKHQSRYDVAWKGKWHLSPSAQKRVSREGEILKWYGATSSWNPPDAGHSLWHSSTLGGGLKYNNDGRFLRGEKNKFDTLIKAAASSGDNSEVVEPLPVSDDDSDSTNEDGDIEEEEDECIFDFLSKHRISSVSEEEDEERDSFFLIASLVNPHDVWASSCFSGLTDDEFFKKTGYHPRDFENLPIELPPNYKDDLSTKPLIQSILSEHHVFGDLTTTVDKNEGKSQSDALRYIRFYAHLHKEVDSEIANLLKKLEETGHMDNTIIIRMADHGENALSHKMREKRMIAYEECIKIPLVINYPTGWFDGCEADGGEENKTSSTRVVSSLVSSIDILPTIAELAGIDTTPFQYRGKSLVPFLRNDDTSKLDYSGQQEDEILFTFDEPLAPPGIPGYVRCIRTITYKYAVYFTLDGKVMEYELYNLEIDPNEMNNLAAPNKVPDDCWFDYHDKLTKLMKKMMAVPLEFDWDKLSKPRMYSWN